MEHAKSAGSLTLAYAGRSTLKLRTGQHMVLGAVLASTLTKEWRVGPPVICH
jgi:hypothetical protein